MKKPIACVTGGTGMIGSRIIRGLLNKDYQVRILTRKKTAAQEGMKIFSGDINEVSVLQNFMDGADLFFHCAAELRNESLMWDVNVKGTESVIRCAQGSDIKYFCHLSSVGVIGKTTTKTVDESTPCNPQNMYEKTKLISEEIVARGINNCKIVILRPTNVIDEKNIGILAMPKRRAFSDYCKLFLKGRECAHIIHAEDVARAALFFISSPFVGLEHFIVSYDDEPLNTLEEIWSVYNSVKNKKQNEGFHSIPTLPLIFPFFLRKIFRGTSNMGDVHYSSKKLLETAFTFKLGLKETIKIIFFADGS